MMVVVFGDFACGLSYLASERVDHLVEHGIDVTWLAVHRRIGAGRGDLPIPSDITFEITAVQSWLGEGEALPMQPPSTRPDTSLAVAVLSAFSGRAAHRLRRRLFEAYWVDGRDIGSRRVVEELAGRPVPRFGLRAKRWRRNWVGLGCPDLPATILEDGTLLRGGEAVDELTVERRRGMTAPGHTTQRHADKQRNATQGP